MPKSIKWLTKLT